MDRIFPHSDLIRRDIISPYSVRMRGNADQNNCEYGLFLHSVRDYLYNAEHFTLYLDKNHLTDVMMSSKLNVSGMRWKSELYN